MESAQRGGGRSFRFEQSLMEVGHFLDPFFEFFIVRAPERGVVEMSDGDIQRFCFIVLFPSQVRLGVFFRRVCPAAARRTAADARDRRYGPLDKRTDRGQRFQQLFFRTSRPKERNARPDFGESPERPSP